MADIDARTIGAALQMAPRERSYLLAQVLSQMNQANNQPRTPISLAANLGAVALNKMAANKALDAEQGVQQKQNQALAQALQQAQGGMQSLPGTGVQLDTLPDPSGAMQGLVASGHPMGAQLAQAQLAQALLPKQQDLKYQDMGGSVGIFDGTKMVGSIPKSVTPDTAARESGENTRNQARLDQSANQFDREQSGIDRRFGISESNQNARANAAEERRLRIANSSLRKEFEDQDAVRRYQRVLPTVEAIANAPDTPAGDLAVVYGAAKVLDPESAVKEGEFETVLKAKSPMESVLGGVRFATTGAGRLTKASRNEIEAMLRGQVDQYKAAYDRDYERYGQLARDQGVDPEGIVGTRFDSAFQKKGPGGVDPVLFQFMTPEERALFHD